MSNSRYILSWDVGIKHLALCLINQDIQTEKFTIEQWLNIDLSDNQNFRCGENKKNGEICGAQAKYYTDREDKKKYSYKTPLQFLIAM